MHTSQCWEDLGGLPGGSQVKPRTEGAKVSRQMLPGSRPRGLEVPAPEPGVYLQQVPAAAAGWCGLSKGHLGPCLCGLW